MECKFKAVLFDFDGVVVDTEGQYTRFWENINREFLPGEKDFAQKVKGCTLVEIFERHFKSPELQSAIRDKLDAFQKDMVYPYIPGVVKFVKGLRECGVKTAVVTSSDRHKMKCVYESRPEIRTMFDRIFTSEDCRASKPSPECYIMAARHFGLLPRECVVAEDSFNGLRSAVSSGAMVMALATTNPREAVEKYGNMVMENFEDVAPDTVEKVFESVFCRKWEN